VAQFFNQCKNKFGKKVNDAQAAWTAARTWIINHSELHHDAILEVVQEGGISVIIANVVKFGLVKYLEANPTVVVDEQTQKLWIKKYEIDVLTAIQAAFVAEGFTAEIDKKKLILSGWDK
jgi:hypothetical protein